MKLIVRASKNSFESAKKLISKKDLEKNRDFKALMGLDYVPIMKHDLKTHQFSAFLGAGVFGKVYEVTDKKGGRWAAKLTWMDSETTEFEIDKMTEFRVRSKLEEIRDSLPESVSKHIIKVHKIKKVKYKDEETQMVVFVYIMQLARKMTDIESQVLYSGQNSLMSDLKLKNLILYPNQLYLLAKKAIIENNYFESGNPYILRNKAKELKKFLIGFLPDAVKLSEKQKQEFYKLSSTRKLKRNKDVLYSFISKAVANNIFAHDVIDPETLMSFARPELSSTKERINQNFINFKTTLINWFQNTIDDSLFSEIVSITNGDVKFTADFYDFEHDDLVDLKAPEEVKSFISALFYLHDKFGIAWGDLHSGNVMVDPKTGDYLAVDVGLFDITS